jgi:hypothetical protein
MQAATRPRRAPLTRRPPPAPPGHPGAQAHGLPPPHGGAGACGLRTQWEARWHACSSTRMTGAHGSGEACGAGHITRLRRPRPPPGLAPPLLHQRRRAALGQRGRGVRRDDARRARLPLRQKGPGHHPRRGQGAPRRAPAPAAGTGAAMPGCHRASRFAHGRRPPHRARRTRRLQTLPPPNPSQVHDVEDLHRIGKRLGACPYYASRNLATSADLVFCPYRWVGPRCGARAAHAAAPWRGNASNPLLSGAVRASFPSARLHRTCLLPTPRPPTPHCPPQSYLLDPVIRRATGVDPEGAVLIFDEAHNIEDISRCMLGAGAPGGSCMRARPPAATPGRPDPSLTCPSHRLLHVAPPTPPGRLAAPRSTSKS